MRKLIALLALTAVAVSALAQGTVDFQNRNFANTSVDHRVYLPASAGGGLLVGTSYVAQLWYGSQGTAAGSLTAVALAPVAFRATSTTLPGIWGTPPAAAVLNGIGIGSTATLQVRVWNTAFGATYGVASTAGGVGNYFGTSALFDYTVPAAGSPPASYYMEGLRSFNLVPEPATIALGVLGVLGLLAIRRRK